MGKKNRKKHALKPGNEWACEISGILNKAGYTVYGFKNSKETVCNQEGADIQVPLLLMEIIPPAALIPLQR